MAAAAPRPKVSTKNLTLGDLMARFGCEDACRDYLEQLRWPKGPRCPRCDSEKAFALRGRNQYECGNGDCGYHFSVTVGTKLQDSKLPLWKWFLATYLIVHAKKGISAKHLQRMLGGSYKTAWFLCHRVRAAMADINDRDAKLSGMVEVDETYIGGKPRKPGAVDPKTGKRETGRGTRKTPVMAIVQREGKVRLSVLDSVSAPKMIPEIWESVDGKTTTIITDALGAYEGVGRRVSGGHKTIKHSDGEWVHGKIHTNTVEGVFSLLKRAIVGSYHKVGKQHLQAYLDEVEFKYNNRGNPYLFRETLNALILSDPLGYRHLTR